MRETMLTGGNEARLLEAIGEYYRLRDNGEAIDFTALLARYSDVADRFGEFLYGTQQVDRHALVSAAGPRLLLNRGQDLIPAAVGDYEIEAEVGRGGMGVVYQAVHRTARRRVALKMMRTERRSAPEYLQRFQIEIQAVAALDHPNIVPIYEIGDHEGRPFFTMKLLEGGALSDYLQEFPADPQLAARVIFTIARALDEAHARGILHRDVKPQNILRDAQGMAYLTDFGLAKLCDGQLDLTTSVATIGSPHYMAPEQARGKSKDVTTASDVYGLGATLYALLTGRPPFESDSLFELLHLIQSAEPVRPSLLNPEVPADLEVICLKCLRKERSERYTTSGELADDLQAFLHGLPIRARPLSSFGRARLWMARNRTMATLSISLVCALVAGTVTSTLFWRMAATRLDEMTVQRNRAENVYRLARESLDRGVKDIVGNPLLKRGPYEKLRLDVLSAQVAFHEQFVREHGADPDLAADLAISHRTLGYLAIELGEQDRALQHFQQSMHVYDSLPQNDAAIRAYGLEMAASLNQIACILYDRKQRPAEAEPIFDRARGILQKVAALDGPPETSIYLSETDKNLGNLRRSMGRTQEALELHQEAVAAARRAVEISPSHWARNALATALSELGFTYERLMRPHEARANYRDAETHYTELALATPDDPVLQTEIAFLHGNLASILSWTDLAAAELEHQKSIRHWEQLVSDHPEVIGHRVHLAEACGYHGDCLRELKKHAESEDAHRKALSMLAVIENPEADATSRARITAYNLYALGLSQAAQSRSADAAHNLMQSIDRYLQLAERFPEMLNTYEMLGLAETALADVHCHEHRVTEAVDCAARAVTRYRKLVASSPENGEYLASLAKSCARLGEALACADRDTDAERLWHEAIGLVPSPPETESGRETLTRAQRGLAALYRKRGRVRVAEKFARDCLAVYRAWLAADPYDSDVREGQAAAATEVANLLEPRGQFAEVRKLRLEAARLLCEVARADLEIEKMSPASLLRLDVREAQFAQLSGGHEDTLKYADAALARMRELGQPPAGQSFIDMRIQLHANRAIALSALGRYGDAVAAWDDAIVADPTRRTWMLINRAVDLSHCSAWDAAQLAIDDAQRRSDITPAQRRVAATVLARCATGYDGDPAKARVCLEGAQVLLQQAVAGGYADHADLEADPHLAILRETPAYRDLLEAVKANVQAAASRGRE